MDMKHSRRSFLQTAGAAGVLAAVGQVGTTAAHSNPDQGVRPFHCVQIDVFTSRRLEGNPLAVFTDARGLSDSEMQGLARETNLQETTFVFPRNRAVERERGVKVRIFIPEEEIPFAGHPTLGTAMVLRNRQLAEVKGSHDGSSAVSEIALDLQVGKIPVVFRDDASGHAFAEMRQIDPVFGATHDRATVASLVGVKPDEIGDDGPIQTVSTGIPFAIVPLKRLSTLQSLSPDLPKIRSYFANEKILTDLYYITRDTQDPDVGLRSRGIYYTSGGEDPGTGAAAGCTASWMVRYGVFPAGKTVHILQGVEIKRPSQIFVRAEKKSEKIVNVRVGGNAVEIMEGDFSL